jgi:DNA polymerase-3 subunit alpha
MFINSHTFYSLRYGTYSPAELVIAAKKKGLKSLVLTDINNTSGAFLFVKACKHVGIKPILGIEFRSNEKGVAHTNHQEAKFRYLGIARNKKGFEELCALLTKTSLEKVALPICAPVSKNCFFVYRSLVKPLASFQANEFLGIRPEEVNRLYNSPLADHQDKLVIFSPVTIANEDHHRAHRILRCIDLNTVIGKLEARHCAKQSEIFVDPEDIEEKFSQYPKIIANTVKILHECEAELQPTYLNNKRNFTGSRDGDYKLLCKLAVEGCFGRFGKENEEALDRTLRELKVINDMGFSAYFLITWDIVRYSKDQGYHHVGRGSGANSIVAYNLGITDVDPMELDLYFERFINPHRTSPPDFDLDFSWDERDDVTSYIFRRYGRKHTALIATYNTFKGKSIIRELGKVLGLPKSDIDIIVNNPKADHLHHHFAKHIFKYGKLIEGLPNYLSIHSGGLIISEEPLTNYTALQLMPKGFPITHFDMYGAEDLEFHKFDVLSQRGLGHIKEAVKLIASNRGTVVDIHDVRKIKQDRKVRQQLSLGQCIGCFYIESPAMRGLLTKLKCDNYVHLIAASSIIRPGVAKSGMMKEYIHRFHHPESYEHIHPVFEQHLEETYGVMVYQEDVMKIVHHFSGLGLAESDILRRIMTGKKKNSSTFLKLREKYFVNCKNKGYSTELTQEVWRQIESFSGYSFCKAHSASFAVESFQSLYLKAYYPLEFMVSVINNFGGFYDTELYMHEARMLGGDIKPPCINQSDYLTNIKGKKIFVGFVHLSSLEEKLAKEVVEERKRNGAYASLLDFVQRVDIDKSQLEILIRIGAFQFTGLSKYQLMWEKNAVHNPQIKTNHNGLLFKEESQEYQLPVLQESPFEQAFDELEILGFPLCSPFDLLVTDFRGEISADELSIYVGHIVTLVGYFVTKKNVTTVNKRLMNFGTWVDHKGKFFDTIHFPPSLLASPFQGKGCYIIQGTIVEEFGFPSIEVDKMDRLPYVSDPRY